MIKQVTHLIAGLGLGGAETMLYQLLSHSKDKSIKQRVVSLGAESYYEDRIRNLGIDLLVFPFKKHPFKTLNEIKKIVESTDTLCCWMYYGNLIGEMVFHSYHNDNNKKIIWNIRHSNLDRGNVKNTIRIVNRLCAKLSRKIDIIAYNGIYAREVHESMGYSASNGVVLVNGCDVDQFYFDKTAYISLKEELGVDVNKRIVLSVAKDDPIKDLPSFIEAFSKIHTSQSNLVAVMCGKGVEYNNKKIVGICNSLGLILGEDVFLLGLRHDIPRLLSGCDLYVLHSIGEAFPNTLIQAMACEALCITTDVGDAKDILDDISLTAYPHNPEDLALKMENALNLSDSEKWLKRKRNRTKVEERFNIDSVVTKYEQLY